MRYFSYAPYCTFLCTADMVGTRSVGCQRLARYGVTGSCHFDDGSRQSARDQTKEQKSLE